MIGGDQGNVGIIRSPVRALIPPDWGRKPAMAGAARQSRPSGSVRGAGSNPCPCPYRDRPIRGFSKGYEQSKSERGRLIPRQVFLESAPPESRVHPGRAPRCFQNASCARPGRVRELKKGGKLLPFPSIFGSGSRLVRTFQDLSATFGRNLFPGTSFRRAAALSAPIDRLRTASAGETASAKPDKRWSPSGRRRENKYRTFLRLSRECWIFTPCPAGLSLSVFAGTDGRCSDSFPLGARHHRALWKLHGGSKR